MRRAYLLIDTAGGEAQAVAEELRRRPGISLVDAVSGPHDVIAILDEANAPSASDVTLEDIRSIEGVTYVTACVAIRAPGG